MTARCATIDFSRVQQVELHTSGNVIHMGDAEDLRPRGPDGEIMTPKQIRARARRRAKRIGKKGRGPKGGQVMTPAELSAMYKPLDDWDLEELARGRPRATDGTFRGRSMGWINRETHEEAMKRFKDVVKAELNAQGVTALDTIKWIISSDETDDRGKPLIPASVKLQASQMLLEHIVGKPTQRVEQDISVKLAGILGSVLVNPNEALALPSQGGKNDNSTGDTPAYTVAHLPGHTIPMGPKDDEPIDVDWFEEGELDDAAG